MINVSDVIRDLANTTITRRVETITTVDFENVVSVVDSELVVIAQPADMSIIVKAQLDTSKEYLMVHSLENIDIGNIVILNSIQYNVVRKNPYGLYGYVETISELIR